ncbi:MAG: PKD domain-containing protein, partial [Candidatus Thermoplasmatota archaeon]|nr:PKD domain-containing protein [Candidatus Thermoplasmatota archaeon]
MAEGVVKTFDGSNLYTSAGYSLYEWDFDYSGTFNVDTTGVSRTHAFMDDGNYTIALRLTDNNFVVTMMTFPQKVIDKSPIAKITSNINPYEGEDLLMNGSTSSSYPDVITKYEWDLHYDGISFDVEDTGSTATVTYLDNGTYYVALRVTDDDGSTTMATVILDIEDRKPVIELDAPTVVTEGDAFSMDAGNTTSWPDALDKFEWDLDHDRVTFDVDATGNMTTHTYMDDGRYTVMLRVYDDDGSYSEYWTNIRVMDLAPEANISAPSTVDEGEVFNLDGSGSTSNPDAIVSWQWDLDFTGTFRVDVDNVTVDHTYMDHGEYTVALRVTDDDGTRHVMTWLITVKDLVPFSTFDIPASINEGETITLDGSGSISYPDQIVSYEWDLQYTEVFTVDLTGVMVDHTFTADGSYNIALRVTDDDGSMTIASIPLEVKDLAPVANYTITGDLVEGSPVTMDARASVSWPDSMVSWLWNMDEDGESVLLNGSMVTHTYMDDGEYTVRLTLTDSDGSITEVLIGIEVSDLGPTARLYPDGGGPGLMAEGDTLSLDATILSTSYPDELVAFEWWWEADGEATNSEDNTTLNFTFHSPGDHVIHLLVRDDDGSESVTSVTVSIIDVGPTAQLTTKDAPEGDPVMFNASGCYEPGMDFATFRWNLDGDAIWDAETDVPYLEHVWYIPGMYQFRMEVEDEDG